MKKVRLFKIVLTLFIVFLMAVPPWVIAQGAQGSEGSRTLKQEELDQLLAPIALYPDSLLSQVLMASTYPLEAVQADRWVKQNKSLKGDALTVALEKQQWDPSVKSLVNFSQVLTMMSEKLDWTQKLGDAFLAQQEDVMHTVQNLRARAQEQGNLKTTKEQKVIVQEKVIVIEPASPQVIYVPTYNPVVVYGAWSYPAYPPYYYYPPGYVATTAAFSFAAGVAIGVAWGYAWGGCNWHGGNVDIDINRNTNINNNINRSKYQNNITTGQGGRGEWKHNPENRKGVAYRDQATAQKYNRDASPTAQTREAYRGRAETGRQDLARADRPQGLDSDRPQQRPETGRIDPGAAQNRRDTGGMDRREAQPRENNAFQGYDRGNQTRDFSNRGNQSLTSAGGAGGADRASSGMSRGGGGARPSGGGRGGGRR